jgi:hypothetical protein
MYGKSRTGFMQSFLMALSKLKGFMRCETETLTLTEIRLVILLSGFKSIM